MAETLFFIASKVGWFFAQPIGAIIALFVFGFALRLFRRPKAGLALEIAAFSVLAIVALSPAGLLMTSVLENRFPRPALPPTVAGIVVLGGSFDTRVARTRGDAELNEAADRVTAALALSRRYPQARIVFSGGLAAILDDDVPEVDAARIFFGEMGLDPARLILEDKARNTVENARYSKALVEPKPGEIWLLVTSAAHMPRAVGCFRVAGFDVLPYPVDYRTPTGPALWRPSSTTRNIEKVHSAFREYLGLAAYYLSGMTDALFPGPTAVQSSGNGSTA